MHGVKSIKRWLTFINVVVTIAGLFGILAIFQLKNGVYLHDLNFSHIKYSSELGRLIEKTDFTAPADIEKLKTLVLNIRDQPIACLENFDFVTTLGTKLIGTYGSFEICVNDLAIANQALQLLDRQAYEKTNPERATAAMLSIAKQFSNHSHQFAPLVKATVDALLLITLIVVISTGLSSIVVALSASRSIMAQFHHSVEMEIQLQAKNAALGQSISKLQSQKEEIALAQKMAEHNALHDPLTDLPNRRYLDQAMKEMFVQHEKLALIHIDIDHFKQINDAKGHEAGDFVLVYVANTLKALIRGGDFVARVGGDEFVVIAKLKGSTNDVEQISRLAERIVKSLRKDIRYRGQPCRVSVSAGIALKGEENRQVKDLFSNADIALYRAKYEGRGRYEFYNPKDKTEIIRRKSIADELIIALEQNQITAFFQPQFNAKTLEVCGMEALARWEHPTKGIIPPGDFLPIAQDLGLLGEIDHHILTQAVTQLLLLDKAGFNIPRVSVNISSQRLKEPNFIDDLMELKLPTHRLSFELLETIFLDKTDAQMRATLDLIRHLGIELEIDDFGSGHASILGLLDVRPSRFKIDREVIRDIDQSESARALVKSIIGIGQSLDMQVVAEGVETAAHIIEIQKTDCDYIQGYALARPMPGEKLYDFIRGERWREVA